VRDGIPKLPEESVSVHRQDRLFFWEGKEADNCGAFGKRLTEFMLLPVMKMDSQPISFRKNVIVNHQCFGT